jgi:[acyl-carrier-protein] S-malonyltransferase
LNTGRNKNNEDKREIIFMFPGQGSQHPDMGIDFLEANREYKKYFEISSELLGKDIIEIIRGKSGRSSLDNTRFSQISIYCLSCALNDYIMQELSLDRTLIGTVLGHSLGEYSALYSSGAFTFKQGAELVGYRSKCMCQADRSIKGMMAAVLGADINFIKNILNDFKEKVFIANHNDYTQVVISGYKDSVKEAIKNLKERGVKRIIPLKVGVASHCPLMKEVSSKLRMFIDKNVEIMDLSLPFFSTTEVAYRNKHDIAKLLACQLTDPIRWRDSIRCLLNMDMNIFVEVGPGKVLSGLVKRIANLEGKEVMILNTDKMEDINYMEESLRKEGLISEAKG